MSKTTEVGRAVIAATRRQSHHRQQLVDAGHVALGWKLAFVTDESQRRHQLSGPVVGFLTSATLLANGSSISVAGWTAPALEAELAIYLRDRVDASSGPARWRDAVAGVGPALEIVDVEQVDDIGVAIAGNLFHRNVVLGPQEPIDLRAQVDVVVTGDGEPLVRQRTARLEDEITAALAGASAILDAAGLGLESGDVVIAGAIGGLIPLAKSAAIEARFGSLGALALTVQA